MVVASDENVSQSDWAAISTPSVSSCRSPVVCLEPLIVERKEAVVELTWKLDI
jgi:hypothetical protein